jgi:hypothetical protein
MESNSDSLDDESGEKEFSNFSQEKIENINHAVGKKAERNQMELEITKLQLQITKIEKDNALELQAYNKELQPLMLKVEILLKEKIEKENIRFLLEVSDSFSD